MPLPREQILHVLYHWLKAGDEHSAHTGTAVLTHEHTGTKATEHVQGTVVCDILVDRM